MVIVIDKSRCIDCHYCEIAIACPGQENCTGCGTCVDSCPQSARKLVKGKEKPREINCYVDGEKVTTSDNQTVLNLLETLGFSKTSFPDKKAIFAPCRTGGCYSCAVLINGQLKPSCITPTSDGIIIETGVADETPKRIVSGFQGHYVGGVGTPKDLVSPCRKGYIEVACFASGCLYRCPTCQNWQTTYYSLTKPRTPEETARRLTEQRHVYNVNRMAISGGESTLNRKWLVEFVKYLKKFNPDKRARIHVDTNASILTSDYIDELVEEGMTDIGPDLKGIRVDTFMKITRVKEQELAKKYIQSSWNAVKYMLDNYTDKIFLGIGIPYNKSFMSLDEITEMGSALASWDPSTQVTVLDYRPEFRALHLKRPSYNEMVRVKEILNDTGLRKVICQTSHGYIR
ncbi:MAG: radical SAM protein [Candidatus Hodarchaeales archaeon]|jgi:pyruvate formate lyase activating enzyme